MDPDGGDTLDERWSALLAAYDQTVAAGHTPDPDLEASAPPELRRRLRRARNCLPWPPPTPTVNDNSIEGKKAPT